MSGIYDNSMFDSGEAPDITTNTNVTSTDGNNTEAPNISGVYPQVDNGNTIILYTTRPGGNDNGNDSGNSDDDNNTGSGTGGGGYTDPDDPSTDTGSTTEYPGVTIIPTITLNAPSSNRTETFTNNSTIEISASGVNCSAIKAYVNGMLVCTAYGNSLSYTYPVNADGEYTVFVYGISSDDVWVASERYTVTFEAANIEGYFKIRNSAGKYLTYVTPAKNNDPISVADENNSDTQIWKIEASTETNRYHIKPALRNSHAVNIYRDGNYPCTMYKVAGNVADTSFTLESAQSNNYTIKWNDETDTRYLTCNGSGTYWAQTVNPQVWTFVPVSYTPPSVEYDKAYPVSGYTGRGNTYDGHTANSRDIPALNGTPIYSTMSGTVVNVVMDFPNNYNYNPKTGGETGGATASINGTMLSYGNYIKIQVDMDGSVLMYAHQQQSSYVQIGDRVFAGQQIGEVGNTGCSTGSHLHFETNPIETD
ncbi:MAG: M23 family metallopeptidase, partial [Clostridia bacterium]|nr:M23 family metallopeptidase [Clostridia bacterium]